MEQTKALNALEPFLALSKSATSPRAAADLIERATTAPNTFIFSELLSTPQIQSLASSPQYSSHLTLLQIFSYGTYETYISTPSLPPLNTAQTQKLRQLSLLSLARTPSSLTYTNLLSSLSLKSERELEDLVISAIYSGLIQAILDPYNKTLLISSVSPLRDLQPDTIPSMLSTLEAWSLRCTSTLGDLERQIMGVREEAKRRWREDAEWEKYLEKVIEGKGEKGEKEGWGKKWGRKGESEDVDMDGDEDGDGEDGKRGKKRGFGLSFGGK